jgi:antitoxin ParD1/3/4
MVMNVSLTPELEAMIRQRVESGRYNNASEVVRDALRHLEEHERLQNLRTLLTVGEDDVRRGNLVDYTPALMDDIYREAEELFRRGEEPDPDVCP